MSIKKFSLFVSFIFFFVCFSSYAMSMEPSEYTSLFQIPQARTYCNDGNLGSGYGCIINGRISSGTCGKGRLIRYPYRCTDNQ